MKYDKSVTAHGAPARTMQVIMGVILLATAGVTLPVTAKLGGIVVDEVQERL